MILHKNNLNQFLSSDDDFLVIEDEAQLDIEEEPIFNDSNSESSQVWKIIIVDDDITVHQATSIALKNLSFEGKTLKFFSAYSVSEAKQLMANHSDIAFILLDVVMDTNDAGLQLIRYIREELKNQTVQITLRTGQPGEAPEESVILAYEINDYKLKTELTRQKLITTVIAALRAYRNAIILKAKTEQLTQTLQTLERTQFQLIHSEKMSALGNLVIGIVHEINNPLSWISGNLEMLEISVKDLLELSCLYKQKFSENIGSPAFYDDEFKEKIERIDLEYLCEDLPNLIRSTKIGTTRLRRLSSSLQIFSKVETTTQSLFDVHQGIDSILLLLNHRLKGNSHHPALEIVKEYGKLPLIECFPTQIHQALMHLLMNAIDALKASICGRSFEEILANPNRIVIQTSQPDEKQIAIHICDNGVGMSEAVKQRAFDTLFTTKPVGQGTGLGLSIVHQIIVEKHRGSLEVKSSLGQGSEFIIKLPIKAI